jgi:hypothetical protein
MSPGFTPDFVNYLESLDKTVKALKVPDVSGMATKADVAAVAQQIPTAPDLSGMATKADVKAVKDQIPAVPDVSGLAAKADIPKPAEIMPMSEAATAKAGDAEKIYARADHVHQRLSEVIKGSLDANGKITITLKNEFTEEPGVGLTSVAANGSIYWDIDWVKTGAKFTGIVITGRKNRTLPTLTALLTDLLKLSGYDTSVPAAGVKFTGLVIKA